MKDQQRTRLFAETLPLTRVDYGEGRAFLILHGGAGPGSVAGLAAELAKHGRVVVPTHPGFDGEPRPDWFNRVDHLALCYLALIERLSLSDVVVIGNSVGGWIAAEMALRHSPRLARIVLLNAVGIEPAFAQHPIVDPMKLAPADRAKLAFHDPGRFAITPSGPEGAAAMIENQRVLRIYAGEPFMYDPGLRDRLAETSIPCLIGWGESDGIVSADYGRRYADSIPGACFERITEAGHFPHIEQLSTVAGLITRFSHLS